MLTSARPHVLLDGAMATQLAARGFELRPPLFSARALIDAPELVAAIHLDYLHAGAQVLTTNSFGLHTATLAQAGIAEQQAALAARSVALLDGVRRRALADPRTRGLGRFRIAGAVPPRPRPPDDERGDRRDPELAIAQYRSLAVALADAGADLILLETFTQLAEIRSAVAAAAALGAERGLPVWLSVAAGAPVAGQARPDGARLVGGEAIAELGPTLTDVDALLINCTQIDAVPQALAALLQVSASRPELPLGLAPHFGKRRYDGAWIERIVEADVFAGQIHAWVDQPGRQRFTLVGACCGSEPGDIAAVRARLQGDGDARERAWARLAELVP